MQSPKTVISQQNLGYIDVIRAIAILMVMLVHTVHTITGVSTLVMNVSQYGQMGVQLFFVASAYTLCFSYVKRAGEKKPLRSFFIRRFFRIAPLYYLAIVGYFLLEPSIHILEKIKMPYSEYTVQTIVTNLLFIHGFVKSANNNIVPGGWSIGTEMAFYALFPMLFMLLRWIYRQYGIRSLYLFVGFSMFLNISFQLAIGQFSATESINNKFIYFNIINQLPVFLLGMTIFFHHQNKLRLRLSVPNQLKILGILTIVGMVLLQTNQNWVFVFIPFYSGISFILLLNILHDLNYSNSILERIGRVSYSMYIFHSLFAWYLVPSIIGILGKQILPELLLILAFVLVVGLTFIVAVFSHRYIEVPGIRWGRALISRL
jgi:peptidoglycan/LPS O-acetylase OafA/YrhL